MGFRYVGVQGIEEEQLELKALALYSDVEDNGNFSCSNELINQLQNSIRWGAKSNFVDIPTDCPQRDERMGWTGDIALFAPTAAYNFNISRFLEKWLLDVKSEQNKGGGIPVTVPLVRVPLQWEIMIPMAVDHWGDVCILAPWAEYLVRGDKGLLERMYPVMKKYIKACKFWAELFSAENTAGSGSFCIIMETGVHRVSACGSGWEEENGPLPHVWQIPAVWQRLRTFWGRKRMHSIIGNLVGRPRRHTENF